MKLRTWHGYLGLVAFLPLFVTAFTGVLLQLRSKVEWIQPSPAKIILEEGRPFLRMEEVIAKFPKGEIEAIAFRPGKGGYQLRMKNGNEIQLHPQTGVIEKDSPRRSTLLIKIHEGSWMGVFGTLGVHFTAGVILVFLALSGLFIFPWRKWRR